MYAQLAGSVLRICPYYTCNNNVGGLLSSSQIQIALEWEFLERKIMNFTPKEKANKKNTKFY